MNEIAAHRVKLVERIHQLHTFVRGMHALPEDLEMSVREDMTLKPNEREGLLRLFFLTSQNWTIWEYIDSAGSASTHKGMAFVTGAIDMEYYDSDGPRTLGLLDFDLPTLKSPKGREWRRGTFDLMGHDVDESPLDVSWTHEQIQLLDDEDSNSV